jgi:hypothetical protein
MHGKSAGRHRWSEIASLLSLEVLALDRFVKRQIEECRELARHAVDEEDRAFWQQAAARWEEQLRNLSSAWRAPADSDDGFSAAT